MENPISLVEMRSRRTAASTEVETMQDRQENRNTANSHGAARPRQPDTQYFALSLHSVIGVVGTVLKLLKYPIAIYFSLRLAIFGLHLVASAASPLVCENPMVTYFQFSFCQSPRPPMNLDDILAKGLKHTSVFDEIQKLSIETNDIPKQLRQEEGDIRDLLIELSAIDDSMRQKYWPFVSIYTDLIDANIASQINLKTTLDSTIDGAFTITSWATDKMEIIKEEEKSPLAIAAKVMERTTGVSLMPTSSLKEVQTIFYGVTEKFVPYIETALNDADDSLKLLTQFSGVLRSLAAQGGADRETFGQEYEKLNNAWFWKWVFRSHRNKIRDFDRKMERCAALCTRLSAAEKVVGRTKDNVMKVRYGLSHFSNDVKAASKGSHIPFDLLIRQFKAKSEHLAQIRDSVHRLDGGSYSGTRRVAY